MNVGEHAPDFVMKNDKNEDVKLSEFKGKNVLLAFFPFAFSPTCTKEMTCFQDDFSQFSGEDVIVLPVSVDSHYSISAFKKSLGVSLTFLSDFSKEVSKRYGVLNKDGSSERAYVLIDKNGIIRYRHIMAIRGESLENSEILFQIRKLGSQ